MMTESGEETQGQEEQEEQEEQSRNQGREEWLKRTCEIVRKRKENVLW